MDRQWFTLYILQAVPLIFTLVIVRGTIIYIQRKIFFRATIFLYCPCPNLEGMLQCKCDPDPVAIRRYVRRRDRWTISGMGGAGRSGDGLRMVSRVSVGGAGRSGAGL